MKLHLINFRIYENKVFDLGSNGITLIAGKSGQGKSTILLAITFALYGTGTKLQTNGKKSCSVLLELDDGMKIYRSKCPNKVLVNDCYENETGESIIREKFGNNLVSYIPQNMSESFIYMTPMARLLFLEKFAFGDIDIVSIKAKIKTLIKTFTDDHNKSLGSLEMLAQLLSETKKPDKIEFPIPNEKPSRELIAKHKHILSEIKNTKESISNNLKKLLEMRTAKIQADAQINELSRHKDEFTHMLDKATIKFESISVTPSDIEVMVDRLKAIIKYNEYIAIKTQYDIDCDKVGKIKADEMEKMVTDIKSLNAELAGLDWTDPPRNQLLDLENKLALYIKHKEYVLLMDRYTEDSIRLKTMKEEELLALTSTLQKLQLTTIDGDDIEDNITNTSDLIDALSAKKKIEYNISNLNVVTDPGDKISKIDAELVSLTDRLDKQKYRKYTYKCPHCSNNSRMVDNKLVVCSSIAEKGEDEALLISEISKLKSRRTKLNDEYTKYSITLQDLNSQLHKQENYLADFDNSEEHNIEDLQDILVQLKKDQVVQNVVRRDILNIKNRIATQPYSDTIVHLSREVEKLGKRVENKPEMTCDYNEDDLRTNIAITTKKIAAIELVNGRYIELRKKIDAIQYNIDNSIFSSSVNMLEDDLRVIKIKLGKLKTINSTHSEEDVRDEISIMKGLLAQKELLALDIAKYKGEIESIAKQLGDIDITLYKNVERDIADAEILIDKCKVDYVAEEALVARLDEWARYAVELKKWKTMKERHDKEKHDEGILRKKTMRC